jgi:hypothetical protein
MKNKVYNVEVTEWFNGTIKPVRVGVYEQGTYQHVSPHPIMGGGYAYWNGKFWGAFNSNVASAYLERKFKGTYQNEPWRGVKVKV